MDNLRYHISRAQFLYNIQIFGTKMFVRALSIQKYVYIFFLDGDSETSDSENVQIYKKIEKMYIFFMIFYVFGTN